MTRKAKHLKRCLICKKRYNKYNKKYCSMKCKILAQSKYFSGESHPRFNKKIKPRICKQCNEKFRVRKSSLRNGKRKFCSIECYKKFKEHYCVCFKCKKKFKTTKWRIKNPKKFCSAKCAYSCRIGKNNSFFGKKHNDLTKIKMSKNHVDFCGQKNPAYIDGRSNEPYPLEFNKKLKEKIRKRDNYRCQECFRHQDELYLKNKKLKLDIHHIDFNKKNNNPNNLISLCRSCHLQTNWGEKDWTKYYDDKVIKNAIIIY